MPTSFTLAALPTSNGGTVIQSNTLNIPAGQYKPIEYAELKNILGDTISSYLGMPQQKAGANWTFYNRSNMVTGSIANRTIIGINRVTTSQGRKSSVAAATDLPAVRLTKHTFYEHTWHVTTMTVPTGQVILDRKYSGHTVQLDEDPATGDYILPTDGYQAFYEGMRAFLKPVAAGAPDWAPLFALGVGNNPFDV